MGGIVTLVYWEEFLDPRKKKPSKRRITEIARRLTSYTVSKYMTGCTQGKKK